MITQPPRGGALRALRRWFAAHAVLGLEVHDPAAGTHTRLVPGPSGPVPVTVSFDGSLRVEGADPPAGWLGLDTDPRDAEAVLRQDPSLAPLVDARPGLRVPGAVDGWETACLAVLGQQVSLGAAVTFAGRLVAAFGRPGPAGLMLFPEPGAVAEAGPERVQAAAGVTHGRSRTVHALAVEAAAGLDLSPGADRALARDRLLAVPGIGPWTWEYVALRALRDPDALPSGDLVLRRVLGLATAREVEARAQAWRPYRGYALLHLWTEAVFADPAGAGVQPQRS